MNNKNAIWCQIEWGVHIIYYQGQLITRRQNEISFTYQIGALYLVSYEVAKKCIDVYLRRQKEQSERIQTLEYDYSGHPKISVWPTK